jgi:REP element-mobilizing transposase RayT
MNRQLALPLKTWGGRREGAGRKPNGDKAGVSHLVRPKVTRHSPVHVTLRLCAGLPSLRRGEYAVAVKAALGAGKQSVGFLLVHYSIQSNHLHLIIEAASNAALSRGMKALSVRVARAVNRARGSKGRVFADRYHAHVLQTPREVRHAIVYVLNNFRKHSVAKANEPFDPCSSALWFDGFTKALGQTPPFEHEVQVGAPRSWLLTTGWRRHRLIDPFEVPRCGGAAQPQKRKSKPKGST